MTGSTSTSRKTQGPLGLHGFVAGVVGLALVLSAAPVRAQNPIVLENQQSGTPSAEWDITGSGDASIQGFATDISVNHGETISFKIKTDATAYHIEIYRLGYYGGAGAHFVATVTPSAALPQAQPDTLFDRETGLVDCGRWAVSASWAVPAGAVSGIYIAKLVRDDATPGASHIPFVVRADESHSALLFQTSDATWQAYNTWGGNSLYVAGTNPPPPNGHASKVSYNRPFITRDSPTEDFLFNAEYPMVRWLEANGYDVTYSTNLDTDRHGALILNHTAFLSVGHDEYWSAGMRANLEAARDAGVHVAFFSGNEVYWKTRWEPSADPSATPDRTLVCYKEGTLGEYNCGGICDPTPEWTGLWRDGCGLKADGCRPENALAGNISWVGTTGSIQVPQEYGNLRFWRNTGVAALSPGQVATFPYGTLGYEWDPQQYDAYYPPGRIALSSTSFTGQVHHLSLYRKGSALVFSAGSVQWSWGLDSHHDRGAEPPDPSMQQATVNLLADMGVAAGSLQGPLTQTSASSDATAPVSSVGAPQSGSTVKINSAVTITGTATDAGGVVGAVEVSTDGGATWRAATGRASWSFAWTPTAYGTVTILSRATDDSGNLETPGTGVGVTVGDITSGPPFTPVAYADDYTTDRNVPVTVAAPGVLANDTDPNGEALSAVLLAGPAHGTLALGADGSLSYTPAPDFTGNDAFTYRAENGTSHRLSNPATVTIAVAQTCPCTIWETQARPAGSNEPDANPLEVGVRFRPDADGYITALRFYKLAGNDGAHTGSLWDGQTRARLAFVTYAGESASGWQTAPLSPPVPVASGHVYVASYHTSTGYAQDTYTFTAYGKDNPPLHALVDGDGGPNGVFIYGAGGLFPTEGFQASNYWADVVFETTVGPDAVPPEVLSMSPLNHALDVAVGTPVTATFSEGVDPTTVTSATFELRDAANQLVPASVGYVVGTRTAVLTPTHSLDYATAYTATVTTGVTDLAHNALATPFTWTFTTGNTTPSSCPCSVFNDPLELPAVAAVTDNQPIELGLKFRSKVNGYVTGLRFYKGALNVGTHVGHLWSATGTLLAEATYTGETGSGWQEVSLDSPVAIAPGVTYVVSYHSPSYFADTHPYFGAIKDTPTLYALADGDDGPNGVYAYGEGGFPTTGADKSNYWVDVVFNTVVPPDTTPPTVTATSPGDGAVGVAVGAAITATFREAVLGSTVSDATFELRDAVGALVGASVSYDGVARTARLAPLAPLAYSSAYTARLRGGTAGPRITDLAGNALAGDVSWTFTTGGPPPPPPTEGPGGPILVLSSAANPFGRYLVEILRAEGLNEFTAMDLQQVTAETLAAHDVVILGEAPLTDPQVTLLTEWTEAGGTLIAMRPDKKLVGLLGLTDAGGTLADRYMLASASVGPGRGITNQTIQFHGTADLYTLNGASSLATLYSDATTPSANPAVTTHVVGTNGGLAVAFSYDLARSVVLTRQGNPAWAGQERDGVSPIRSDDLFYGAAAGDVQPDWVDLGKVAIPQADEQQRLLANVILLGNLHRKPLPRFWYFPKGKKAVIIMTGDDHGDAGMQPRFDKYLSESPSPCSVDDWDCVRATGYEYVDTTFTDAQARQYSALGFEVALHVNTNCQNWTPAGLESNYAGQLGRFGLTFPGIASPTTNRTHCIAWSDWSTQPETEVAHGIRLDTNYYFWPPAWVQNRPGLFTGSGMPMRFAKLDGTLIDCFQAATQMTDESDQSYPMTSDSLLVRALDARGYYGAFCANMHFDNPDHPGSNAIVGSALSRGVPVVSARQMLTWLDGRNASSFGAFAWSQDALSFTIAVGTGARNLVAMVPTQSERGGLTGITLDNGPVAYTTETVKGIEYALFPAAPGSYVAQYVVDTAPPLISGALSSPHPDGTATVTWTTNEPATSRVDFGVSADSLTQSVADPALVTAHSLTLDPSSAPRALPAVLRRARPLHLAPNTTYYYRVRSTDAASNTTMYPAAGQPPLGFDTPPPECFVDRTEAQFALGDTVPGTSVTNVDDGEVTLGPALGAEFLGSALPAGWSAAPWGSSGGAAVGSGALSVEGARAMTDAGYGPGRSLEFVASFGNAPFQHVGFVTTFDFGGPWAIISTNQGDGSLYARTSDGTNVVLAGSWLGAPHRYRIDWDASGFRFSVDGSPLATSSFTIASAMHVIASDADATAPALTVDWIHLTPFAPAGQFTSRVYDAGATTAWGPVSWTADVPGPASLGLGVRFGDTPSPDGTWSPFLPVSSSGTGVGGRSQYIQYRASLATTDVAVTPVLRDVHVACSTPPGADPPLISSVAVAPAATSASITWLTDESADAHVAYGTSPTSLTSEASSPTRAFTHNLLLSGLLAGTTYYLRVTSTDASSRTATAPDPTAPPLSFTTTSAACPSDQTAADFAAGTLDAGTSIALGGDGEVILAPVAIEEFSGASLPGDMQRTAGGTLSAGGGQVTLDGGGLETNAVFGPGVPGFTGQCSMEFVATFTAGARQHVGFVADLSFNDPWIIFSTSGSSTDLYARASGRNDILIPGSWLGAPHRYRIDWDANANLFTFWIDSVQVATQTLAVAQGLHATVWDNVADASALAVDWLRVTPYASSGTFLSRIFDGGGPTNWGVASWTASTAPGTGLAISARTGDVLPPDASWTGFGPVVNGSPVGGNSRYLQYRADLTGAAPGGWTPELASLAIACAPGSDAIPPVIANVAAASALDGRTASLTWSTDEPADSRVAYGINPAALLSVASDAARVRAHAIGLTGLTPGTAYFYRVSSADAAHNEATSPAPPAAPLSFVATAPACLVDRDSTDFWAGDTTGNGAVIVTGDGEVSLKPEQGEEFEGSSLHGSWVAVNYGGGSWGVADGHVRLDGWYVAPSSFYTVDPTRPTGYALDFEATFLPNAVGQHVGFGNTLNESPWAIFSTKNGGHLYARTQGSAAVDHQLPDGWLGAPHHYRVEWQPHVVRFWVDGTKVDSVVVDLSGSMRPIASDGPGDGSSLTVDWMRMAPYRPSGTFTSRVYDAGARSAWVGATWNADVPAGTTLGLSVRRGDTLTPDGTWTAFVPVTNGGSIGGASRFVQYRADLVTSDSSLAPVLRDVSLSCAPCVGAPPAVTGLAATRLGEGGSEGRLPIRLDFTLPPEASNVEVYRAGFGRYPEYNGPPSPGAEPAVPSYPPTAPWQLTSVTASGQSDLPPERDFWYYVAFAKGACGDASVSSARTGGTLDYRLGDVADGLTPGVGDGTVGSLDISLLGGHYGLYGDDVAPYAYLDVGPTTDYSPLSRPVTDDAIEFEDLVVFSMTYGETSAGPASARPAATRLAAAERDELALDEVATVAAGQTFEVPIRLRGAGRLQALSVQLGWDPAVAEPLGVEPGELLPRQNGVVLSARPGDVDAAVLGPGRGIAGEGVLATVRFRARAAGDPRLVIARVDARDPGNRKVELGGPSPPERPTVTSFAPAIPNPFQGTTTLGFSLAKAGKVELAVFSVDGRRVRVLAREGREAGVHRVVWDGTDDQGQAVKPGLYYARLVTPDGRFTRTLVLMR